MLNRILIYCVIVAGTLSLLLGYFWFKERQTMAAAARQLAPMTAEIFAERDGLESLGNVDLSLAELTYAELETKLHEPTLKQPGEKGTTKLGWACGKERCAIWIWFGIPFGGEIPVTAPPIALVMSDSLFAYSQRLAIGDIYLGETAEEMKESCRKRGYGVSLGRNRISWDKDWNLVWGDIDGKIHLLVFTNERRMKNIEIKGVALSTCKRPSNED